MSGRAGRMEVLEEIKSRLDAGQVLRAFGVQVRSAGSGRARARCPFHDDRDPSLVAYPDGGWYCFGCGEGGDVIDLVWKFTGGSFRDAVMEAGRLSGVETGKEWFEQARKYELIGAAVAAYSAALDRKAIAYLRERGFPEEFCRSQRIGYSPSHDYLARRLGKAGYALQDARRAGLVLADGRDAIGSGYIVLPVSLRSRYVDLQGRAFPEGSGKPRYRNLPVERTHMYGEDNLSSRRVLVCEGIFDALSARLCGFPAVATYGTGGFKPHWKARFSRCEVVYVCFDRDALVRAARLAVLFGVRGRVVILPESLGPKGDLNDLLRSSGPQKAAEVLRELTRKAPTGFEVLIDSIDCRDAHLLYDRARALLAAIYRENPISRRILLARLADRCGLDYSTVLEAAREASESAGDA